MTKKRQDEIHQNLDRVAAWLISYLETLAKHWLTSVPDRASPLYYEYIEGMLAEYAEKRRDMRSNGCSDIKILAWCVPSGIDAAFGIFQLTSNRYLRTVRLFLYGVKQVLALNSYICVLPGFASFNLRGVLWFLRFITGKIDNSAQVVLKLNPTGEILVWGNDAEAMFCYTKNEILGKAAIGTFIPEVETGGRTLTEVMGNVCTSPEYYSLNVNENQDSEGNRFWMFWVNLPTYVLDPGELADLTEISCVGFKIDDPHMMKQLVDFWKHWVKPFPMSSS